MKILIVMPHYYQYKPGGIYGSESRTPEHKIDSLRRAILAFRELFTAPQSYFTVGLKRTAYQCYDAETGKASPRIFNGTYKRYHSANDDFAAQVDIVLCTDGEHELLAELGLPLGSYERAVMPRGGDPMVLGFFAHQVMAERSADYDYYCYMEDDLVLQDRAFFWKLQWFQEQFGEDKLLLPHRFERDASGKGFSYGYVDADGYENPATSAVVPSDRLLRTVIDFMQEPELRAGFLGRELCFHKARNPHSGCFFLSAKQFTRYRRQSFFAVPNQEWVGPLESAATWGIARTFSIYKPDYRQAAFFELEHADPHYLNDELDNDLCVDRESFRLAGRENYPYQR